ncbi:helix-turn-helix domain-containing protein [Paeniglutamicibacter sp. MACA_103]|uniref:helix-turn-helix domain-containing protein n=1 Tax=Paeniglutamicibacter sp. MACA_103 TaxID=3377337 RepID=UPI003893857D
MLTSDFPRITQNDQSDDARRWVALLERLDVGALTDEFIERLGAVPSYAVSPLPASEIRRTGSASFEALILAMKAEDDEPDYLRERDAIALDVGVSRARAGVPIEALMTAIRLDFSVIWEAITGIAEPGDAQLLVGHTARVWEVVDGYAGETQRAYVAELARIQAEAASMRQGYLATLFSEKSLTPAALERIAEELGQDLETEYVVAVAMWDHIPALRLALANAQADSQVFTYSMADALVVFFPLGLRAGSGAQRLYASLERLSCGLIGEGCTLERVPHAAAVAASLAKLLEPAEPGAMTWARGWARMARRELDREGAPGLGEVERALEKCGATERRRLREAVDAYLQSGRIAQAAEQLYCHRNTLMNRLKRFAQLTGVDPTIPVQAARLVVGWS